jgi:hypothetical protein
LLNLHDHGYRNGTLVLVSNAVSQHPFQLLQNRRPNLRALSNRHSRCTFTAFLNFLFFFPYS